MTDPIEIVERVSYIQHRLVIIDKSGCVWLTHCAPWHDICAWIIWWLQPGKKAWLQLRVALTQGEKGEVKIVRVRAKRVSKSYVRL